MTIVIFYISKSSLKGESNMAKRLTDEERVTQFFHSAEYLVAKTTFNIVKGTMKRRAEDEEASPAAPKSTLKKTRKKKGATVTGTGTGGTTFNHGANAQPAAAE